MKQKNVLVLEKKDLQQLVSNVVNQPINNITIVGEKELEIQFVFNSAPVAPAAEQEPTPNAPLQA